MKFKHHWKGYYMIRYKVYTIIYAYGRCFVQTHPNTGAAFGETNNIFGGIMSYVLPLFSTLSML